MNAALGLILFACTSLGSTTTCTDPITAGDVLQLARVAYASQTSSVISIGTGRPRPGASDAVAARLTVCVNRRVLQIRNGTRAYRSVGASCADYGTQTSSAWARGGPRCAPGSPFAHLARCSERALAARDGMRVLQWATLRARAPHFRSWIESWARGEIPPPPGTERAVHTTMCPIVSRQRRCTGGAERFPGVVFYGSNGLWPTPTQGRRRGSATWRDDELPRIVPWEDGCEAVHP